MKAKKEIKNLAHFSLEQLPYLFFFFFLNGSAVAFLNDLK